MRVKIKFCGLTNLDDSKAAVEAGADALGFVFYPPSPRFVAPADAAGIIAQLPPFVSTVGLFVDASEETLREAVAVTGIDVIQYHGAHVPAQPLIAGRPWIRALQVRSSADIEAVRAEQTSAKAILLDAWDEKLHGGTGRVFDWKIVPRDLPKPLILAGGLTPENIASAVRMTTPWAVDVSGGIELSKGRKDIAKMHRFVEEVRKVERES
jgi:phosphoribosylanthranilate isomerase